jgi:hypothetical protein
MTPKDWVTGECADGVDAIPDALLGARIEEDCSPPRPGFLPGSAPLPATVLLACPC